jgi:hypothetical protein
MKPTGILRDHDFGTYPEEGAFSRPTLPQPVPTRYIHKCENLLVYGFI